MLKYGGHLGVIIPFNYNELGISKLYQSLKTTASKFA